MRSMFTPAVFLLLLIQTGLAVADETSSIANLPIAPGPFQPTMDSLKQYKCPDWFRDAKFGIWAHWGPQSVPMEGDWYASAHVRAGRQRLQGSPRALGSSLAARLEGHHPAVEGREVGSRSPHGALQEGRSQVFRQHGIAPRRLLPLELQAAQVERREHGTQPRRGRRLAEGGQEVRAAFRRLRASRRQLHLVPSEPRLGQDRAEGGRTLRRGQPQVPGPLPLPGQARRQRLVQQRSSLATAVVRGDQGTGRQLPPRPAL